VRPPRTSIRLLLAVVLLAVLAAEIGLRAAGFIDFPIYDTDAELAYLPRPSQQGAFMNRNRWAFNDRSMPIGDDWRDTPAAPGSASDLLLLGNSIVMGGNPYDQPDKLGPQLQSIVGPAFKVWPMAVGGWTNVNQMAYLDRQADVAAGAEFFVWQVMSEGFGDASPWRGEYVFPTQRPASALAYVVRRYLLPRFIDFGDTELPEKYAAKPRWIEAFDQDLAKLVQKTRQRHVPAGVIYLFPSEAEFAAARAGREWLPERAEMRRLAAAHGIELLDVAADPLWHAGLYRDGVHLTVEGTRVLAGLIGARIQAASSASP
jgi:hypothetical protein